VLLALSRTPLRLGFASPPRLDTVQRKLVTPAIVKRTVTPKRPANGKLRTREYLTEAESSD